MTSNLPALYRRTAPVLTWIAAVLAVLVAVLFVSVRGHDGLTGIDDPIFDWVTGHRAGWMTPIATTVSDIGGMPAMSVLAALACLVLAWRRLWSQVVLVGVATAGAGALVTVVKYLVGRNRPPENYHLVLETNKSFPSGHSLGSMVVIGVLTAVVLAHVHRPAARVSVIVAATVFVAAVGLSRVCLGVHWPTDVLGGWSIGALWLTLCLIAYRYQYGAVGGDTPPAQSGETNAMVADDMSHDVAGS